MATGEEAQVLGAAAAVNDGEEAAGLLAENPSPAAVRTVALRADELRFERPAAAQAVAEAALDAFSRLPPESQWPAIGYLAWAVYASILRTRVRFQESEFALRVALAFAPRCRPEARADIERRLAYLRAGEGKASETRLLVERRLRTARHSNAQAYAKELVSAGAVLMIVKNFHSAKTYLEEALRVGPLNGDRRHIAAVFNLATCHLELSSSSADLLHALALSRQAARLVEHGSHSELKLRWQVGKIQHRLGRLEDSLESLESARQGLDEQADAFDRSLLLLDLAELHLDREDAASASELAQPCFGVLSAMSRDSEAYRALMVFQRAAVAMSLDRATVHDVREQLLELRRRPRQA